MTNFLIKRKLFKEFQEAANRSAHRVAVRISLIRRDRVAEALQTGCTDPMLFALMRSIVEFFECNAKSTVGRRALCLTCDTEFSSSEPPADFLVTSPSMIDLSASPKVFFDRHPCALF